jgi:AraC-like DNA-binding protein
MSTLHSSLYAAALLSCLFALFLGRKSLRAHRGAGYLLALLALLVLNFTFEWLMSNPSTPVKALWLSLVMGLAFFLAPCLWLYARSLSEPQPPRLRELPRVHFVPIVLGLLLLLPLLERTHSGTDFAVPGRTPDPVHALWVHGTMLAAIALFALQASYYLRASHRILKMHSRAAKALLSDNQDRELNTLRLMMFVVGAHWAVGIGRALHCLLLGKDASFIILFPMAEVMFTLWVMAGLMRATVAVEPRDRQLANEMADAKYARSALDAPTRARITRKLADAWADQRLHRDSRLTLRMLCERLRENPHYVSQVINQDLGTNFYDLVNRNRIRDAMDALLRNPDQSVMEIAAETGFNSKSTFNAAFRQHAGTTPSEFRQSGSRSSALATSDPAG